MIVFPVSARKVEELRSDMERLGIAEEDLEEEFIRGTGSGGQKINKTSSCVVITHRPSGIRVRCQRERSQALNRFFARRELCDRVEERLIGRVKREQAEREKIRRQKRKRSKRAKEKMLHDKGMRSKLKAGRRSVRGDE